jgi:hypothetical protein
MDIEKMQPILIGGRHAPGEESGLASGATSTERSCVGIHFGGLILRTVSSATSPLSGVLEMMVPLMGVSMVAGIAGKV